MGKAARLALGALTLWPLAYVFIFLATVVRTVFSGFAPGAPAPLSQHGPPAWFGVLFVAHLATMLLMLALAVFYVVHAYRSQRVPESRRVMWVVLNVIGGFIGQLAYWYLFIWREPQVLETRPAPGGP